jgi:hypothetical protein
MRLLPLLLVTAALATGCAGISVPPPSSLDATIPTPGVLTTNVAGPVAVPSPKYLPGSRYQTSLEGVVLQHLPSERSWRVSATATSEIGRGPDGGLAWRVQQIDGQAWLDGAPEPLTDEQKKALLQDYRLDREALTVPRRGLNPGESWTTSVPIVRIAGDGSKTTGQQEETTTFLGLRKTPEGDRAVLRADVMTSTATKAPNGADVLALSSRAIRQVEVHLETGSVEVDILRRHEIAAGPGSRTETDGTVKHARQL